jgi:pyrroline-5-carboxylate reductase
MEAAAGNDKAIVRVNPNTPAMVGEGINAVSFNKNVSENNKEFVLKLFKSTGLSFEMDEDKMNAITALAGSGPAFVFMAIEAMADAGVYMGLPRDLAIELSAQTFLGASKLVKETGEHPAVLKDRVASPAGTTIEGIFSLEVSSFRAAVMDAVISAKNKADNL